MAKLNPCLKNLGSSIAPKNRRGHLYIKAEDAEIKQIMLDLSVDKKTAKSYRYSIRGWSQNDYKDVRKFQSTGIADYGLKDPSIGQSKRIEEFIKKSQSFEGEIYRGIKGIDIRKNFANMNVGDMVDMQGTSSWTSKYSKALKHSQVIDRGQEINGVVFKLKKTKSGTSITHISAFPQEGEVIASESSRFKLVKTPKVVTDIEENIYLEVIVEEIL